MASIGVFAAPVAVAGPTWDGGGNANATWTNATNWDANTLPDFVNGTSDIVFSTLGAGGGATQLGGGLVDIRSLRSDVATGQSVALGTTGVNVTGFSINSGTLTVRSGTIVKASQAAVVINSTLRLVSDGYFSSTDNANTGLIIAGPITEDATSRNVVINASLGSVALGGVNTYTGSTTVERGTLLVGLQTTSTAANAGISAAPGVAGALGNATSTVVVGNANTTTNNWDVGLTIGSGVSMSRHIRFAAAGTGAATLTTNGTATLRSGTITLDRTITWTAGGATQSWAGLVTGTGGFSKGGGNTLRLTNTANDFSGSVSVVNNDLQYDISGAQNALGSGTSAIQATDAGATTNRAISAFGSGTVSRGFNVVATAAQTVTINTGDAGDVLFSGGIALNSLGANVLLGAANNGTSRFTGVISGSAPVVAISGASSSGNRVLLSNTNNSFTGQVRVGNAGLFIGGNAPSGTNGVLGNATTAVVVGVATSGVNPSYLMTDGAYTVGRNLVIAGPSDGSADAFTGDVMIGGATADASVYSGSLAINRTAGIGTNFLFATTGGSVEFSGAISGSAAIKIGGGGTSRTGLGGGSTRVGSVILSGNNSGYSGSMSLGTGARLVVASNSALGSGTGTISVYDGTQVTSGTGGVSTRGAVTVGRNFLLDGSVTNANQNVSFEGTSADASVFTGSITINRPAARVNAFSAVAGGSVDFQGVITGTGAGGVNITKNGDGLVIFSAQNNYQGTTTINAGVLRGTDGVGISGSNVLMAGGVWESAGNITRATGTGTGQMQLTAANSGSSGFSSANAAGMTVAVGGTAAPTALTWGSGNFVTNALVLNDTTATGPLAFLNAVNLGSANRAIFVGANAATISGSLSGAAGGLVKRGAGTLVLSASNSYAGGTTINAGRLEIAPTGRINASSGVTIAGATAELRYNSAAALTAPITFTQGTISGTGTIGTAVTVAANDVISPGNSPGIQAYAAGLTMASGGSYVWEINDWLGTAGDVSSGFDQIAVSGSPLDITANSGSRFTIAITGLSGTAAGVVPNFAGTTGRSFTIATSAAGITGFAADKFTLATAAFTNNNPLPQGAGFYVSQSGNNLILNYALSARYTLTGSAAAAVIRTTGSTTLTATITSDTTAVTNPDALGYAGLSLSGAAALSSTTGTLAGGESGSGSVSFSTNNAGAYTFTPSITTGTNVNVGTAAIATATSAVTVTVYNPAAANTLTGSSFGTVLRDTALSQTLLITNTSPPGGFTERLDAAFGTVSGPATTNSGSISLLAAGSSSTALVVNLSTATAGVASGTVQVNFTTNGQGTSGLAPLALNPQTLSLSATVLDPAVASFVSGTQTSLLIDFGSVNQSASVDARPFDIWNVLQTAGFTADLALLSVSGTGDTSVLTTDLPTSFTDLVPDNFYSYSASFADTSTPGSFESVYTLRFKSATEGTVFDNDSEQLLTLTLQGVIVVPEPASALLAAAGLAGLAALRRRRWYGRFRVFSGTGGRETALDE